MSGSPCGLGTSGASSPDDSYEAYAQRGDVEAACAQTMAVLDTVEAVNSARVDDRVVVLRRALHPFADAQAVRDVEERTRELLRTA